MNDPFEIVGVRPELLERQAPEKENRWYQGVPWLSVIVLLIIAGGCLFCKWIMPKDPSYMDLKNYTVAPCREFLFGTDTMGRDIFSMIWYGGRQSLFIGFVATMISTGIAIIFGTVSGLAPEWLDMLLMRMTEILLSIPNLLLVIFLQAILGKANVLSLSLVIGITSWTSIAKVVRTEVRQLRSNEYVVAARMYGWRLFLYSPETSCPQLFIFYYVHGSYEYSKCDCGRIYAELYGDRVTTGDHLLGKHVVTVRKSIAYRWLVDHSDSRGFSCCNLIGHYRARRLSEKRVE